MSKILFYDKIVGCEHTHMLFSFSFDLAYQLLNDGTIKGFKIGNQWKIGRIWKILQESVSEYVITQSNHKL